MPIYAYLCRCGVRERFTRSISGFRDSYDCPECGETARIIPAAAGMRSHEGPGNWDVKTADGKYRVSHYLEASQEAAYARERD